MSSFNAKLSDAKTKISSGNLATTLWVPEFGWTNEEALVAEEPFDLQLLAAYQCFQYFFLGPSKRVWIHLAAEMQAGKTGVVTALLRLLFANASSISITPVRVFIVTGMNDNAWVKQTKERIPLQCRSGVAHNGGLDKIDTALERLAENSPNKILANVLIVIDESQYASNASNRPNRHIYDAVGRLCPRTFWEKNNIRFLTISATDPAKVAAMADSAIPNKVVRLYTSSEYQSVEKLRALNRIFAAEDYGDLHEPRAIAEIKSRIATSYTTPLYHILRCRNGKHGKVQERLESEFPGCSVIPWDAINKPSTTRDDVSSVITDINELLKTPPSVHTFILLKNMFYAAKTMNDTYVGILYDRVGGKDDTNLQSLLGRACGYRKSTRTIIYTSRQTVDNYLEFWKEAIAGQTPLTDIPSAKLDKKMPGIRVVTGINGEAHGLHPTQAHAAPGGRAAGAPPPHAEKKKQRVNDDDYTGEWKEFATFAEAKAHGSRIQEPSLDESGRFYMSSCPNLKICRYDELIAAKSWRSTAHMPLPKEAGKRSNRLYTGYKDLNNPQSAVFFIRTLTRIR